MSKCPKIEICPFFNGEMPQLSSTVVSLKEVYCHADYDKCARYQVALQLGSNHVPDDLFPFESKKIETIRQGIQKQVSQKNLKK